MIRDPQGDEDLIDALQKRCAEPVRSERDYRRLTGGRRLSDRENKACLGWGEHIHAEYVEGDPAPAVPAGTSLGRVPDGVDTEQNARDWQPLLAPSPGAKNRAIPPFLISSPGHHSTGHGHFALDLAWRMTAGATVK